jgi:hypothetical protein
MALLGVSVNAAETKTKTEEASSVKSKEKDFFI